MGKRLDVESNRTDNVGVDIARGPIRASTIAVESFVESRIDQETGHDT